MSARPYEALHQAIGLLLIGAALLLSACGRSPGAPAGAGNTAPRAAQSTLAAPIVEGPISGGLRGRPWAGTVEALAPLTPFDYVQEEFFFEGTAQSRDQFGEPSGFTADYRSRLLVQRPRDPARFNGTVFVEWLNVTGEMEIAVLWALTHPELLREGYAYVGVSVQSVGVNSSPLALKFWDPLRYASLRHPGDAFEFDIFSQAARALVARDGPAPLGDLQARRLIGGGESQSADLMISYANRVQQDHQVFDGFFLHTWPGPIKTDIDVPVLMFLTETESDGLTSPLGPYDVEDLAAIGSIPGAGPLRAPTPRAPSVDHAQLRVWELAGATHLDSQALEYVVAQLAQDLPAPVSLPPLFAPPVVCVLPPNQLAMARPTRAALHQLDRWMRSGRAPPSQPRLVRNDHGRLERDADGFVLAGIRMPNYAVPLGLNRGDSCVLLGTYRAWTDITLRERYGDAATFRAAFAAAAQRNVEAGTLLPEDAEAAIREVEALTF